MQVGGEAANVSSVGPQCCQACVKGGEGAGEGISMMMRAWEGELGVQIWRAPFSAWQNVAVCGFPGAGESTREGEWHDMLRCEIGPKLGRLEI